MEGTIKMKFKKLVRQIPIVKNMAWKAYFFANHLKSNAPKTPCHYNELFINSKGEVYPCCYTWGASIMKIGHISDDDILKKIEQFNAYCACSRVRFRKLLPTDNKRLKLVIIELSLACQGACAMCCVDAPSWHGKYDLYEPLAKFIDSCHPEHILVQGGELLIQKESLKWLYDIKDKYPALKISLVTNGNVDLNLVKTVEDLFDWVAISIVGFEPETYKKIMGLDMSKTVAFAEKLTKSDKIKVCLKYLITPLNLHESNLFLRWAIKMAPERISICDANTPIYINDATEDKFWSKIIKRTSQDIKSELISSRTYLMNTKTIIGFDLLTQKMFEINENFIKDNALNEIVDITSKSVSFVDFGVKSIREDWTK